MHPKFSFAKIIGAFAILAPFSLLYLAYADPQDKAKPENPHASGKVNVPAGASEVAYCNSCHKDGCNVPHPELVKLTWAAKGKVVLGVQNEITCGTCHTRGFRKRSDAFLGRNQQALCNTCHFDNHKLNNSHTTNDSCDKCHSVPKAGLANPQAPNVKVMKTDVDTECLKCHYDGPVTHPDGVPNSKKKAPDLPLSADGKITCVTCHIGHKTQDKFGKLLRKDNKRGGLCLSCHEDL